MLEPREGHSSSRTSVSVCCGVSVSVEFSFVEVITDAIEVGVSNSSGMEGASWVTSLTSAGGVNGEGPSALCS